MDQKAQPYRTRLEIVFASNAPKAVILRRGPKRHYHLIEWNLKDDTFTHGQWMKGIVRLCDVSPSGDKLLYWAAQYHASRIESERRRYASNDENDPSHSFEPLGPTRADADAFQKRHPKRKLPRYMQPHPNAPRTARALTPRRNEGVWTAISRAPYFSALAIWPADGHWTGGGYFRSDNEVVLNEADRWLVPVANVRVPANFRMTSSFGLNDLAFNREMRERAAFYETCRERLIAVRDAVANAGERYVDRLEPRADDTLILAVDGAVYRVEDWEAVAPDDVFEHAVKLADFNGLSFEMIAPPPSAMRWG